MRNTPSKKPAALAVVGASSPSNAAAIELLRRLARDAAEAGADPSLDVSPDHQLLSICDDVVRLSQSIDGMWEEFRQLLWPDPRQQELARQSIPMARLARRTALRAASRLPAKTAGGIFAKAMAVKHASDQAPVLARSLADDILRNSELRAVLCPVNTQDTASAA